VKRSQREEEEQVQHQQAVQLRDIDFSQFKEDQETPEESEGEESSNYSNSVDHNMNEAQEDGDDLPSILSMEIQGSQLEGEVDESRCGEEAIKRVAEMHQMIREAEEYLQTEEENSLSICSDTPLNSANDQRRHQLKATDSLLLLTNRGEGAEARKEFGKIGIW